MMTTPVMASGIDGDYNKFYDELYEGYVGDSETRENEESYPPRRLYK